MAQETIGPIFSGDISNAIAIDKRKRLQEQHEAELKKSVSGLKEEIDSILVNNDKVVKTPFGHRHTPPLNLASPTRLSPTICLQECSPHDSSNPSIVKDVCLVLEVEDKDKESKRRQIELFKITEKGEMTWQGDTITFQSTVAQARKYLSTIEQSLDQ